MAYPLPEKPSIAVLPFDNLTGNPDQDIMVDGLVEALSAISKLFIISRNSNFLEDARRYAEEALRLRPNYSIETFKRANNYKDERITERYADALRAPGIPGSRGSEDEARSTVKKLLEINPAYNLKTAESNFVTADADNDARLADTLRRAGLPEGE